MVQRHPLDMGWALYKIHFQGGFLFSYDLVKLAEYTLAFCRLSQHWKTVLPSDAPLEVSYEEIV
ncbi:MAG: hypothetical protein DLM68_03925 [Hyphomicrobiales bacterium]|nr:MAG: hypothetical protein DLM68_03925 [Hyphomicrobiales bacterium]